MVTRSAIRFGMLTFFLFASLALAQHVHYEPEWVHSVVASATEEFKSWITYAPKGAPHGFGPKNHTHPYPFPQQPQQAACSFWLENIQHLGRAPFQPNAAYQVFRNVKDYGAKGDGVADDTAAINAAISAGNRCVPGSCASTTTTPALVYFPNGTYVISSSIIDYYYTQLIGNPNCMPVLQATPNFTGLGLIDGDPYGANGLSYGSTNVFFRQIRNFVLDLSNIPGDLTATGIHWPTAQATSIQNVIIYMSDAPGTQHQGILIEEGSGGFMTDIKTFGGLNAYNFGNQQFTMRNLSASNAVVGINQLWDWGWAYKGVTITNCSVGLNMSSGGAAAQTVGSITLFDSTFTNCPIGVLTAHSSSSQPPAAGSLIIENVQFNNVQSIVQGPQGTVLLGSSGNTLVAGWGEGHEYLPNGPTYFEGPITPNARPASLLSGSDYYARSKPQYESQSASSFVSARSLGAQGDGQSDDTGALQAAIYAAKTQNKILFIDAGDYVITSTLYIPGGSRIVGETYPVILASGSFFTSAASPKPAVSVGSRGESGSVELSDFIVSGRGALAGAIFIEYNLASSSPNSAPPSDQRWGPSWGPKQNWLQPPYGPSGLWDVHIRIGGFAGSSLQIDDCPTTPTVATPPAPVNQNCIAGFMSMHVTSSASNLYMENNWLWIADHDIEDPTLRQITIYNGRGLYVDNSAGPIWLYGTAVEHHVLYEYQFSGSHNVYMGQIQTETAYYQPNPPAPLPVTPLTSWNDPIFPAECLNRTGFNFTGPGTNFTNNCDGWGVRITNGSSSILTYSAGLYSFFDNYNTTCSAQGSGAACQSRIFSIEGSSGISMYNLNTVGAQSMIDVDGRSIAAAQQNVAGFSDTIALFRT